MKPQIKNRKTIILPIWAGKEFQSDEKVILPEFRTVVKDKTTQIFKGSKLIVELLDRGDRGFWIDFDSTEIRVFNE
jgi:hypothetical protein